MSYTQYKDPYYARLVLTGQLPNPFCFPYFTSRYFPNLSTAPNLSNQDCDNCSIWPLNDYYYNCANGCGVNNNCTNGCGTNNNLFYNKCDPCYAKYDYCYYDRTPYQNPCVALSFTVQNLVSNVPECVPVLDLNLLDPWGIIIINDVIWVANTASGLLTQYDLLGRPLLPPVNVFGPINNIAQPTGIAQNSDLSAFPLVNGPIVGPSLILTATRDGTINGYNADIDPNNCILLIDNSTNNSVYTGLEIVGKTIYVTDFYNQKIDVFDGDLKKITTYPFIDEFTGDPISENYAPYNIINIGEFLYVTYAKQSPLDNQYQLPGRGHGYISIFTVKGEFVRRFVSHGTLNSPWGLVSAPSCFSFPPGSIMVSNFGDGKINIFDHGGKCVGTLTDKNNNEIYLEGLKGLVTNPNCDRILYWTQNADNLRKSFMGTINPRFIV
jgi:uncharacterized protein (TIGR03118 family)